MSEASDSPTLSIRLDETKDSAGRVECLHPWVDDQLRAVTQRALAGERPAPSPLLCVLCGELF